MTGTVGVDHNAIQTLDHPRRESPDGNNYAVRDASRFHTVADAIASAEELKGDSLDEDEIDAVLQSLVISS